MWGELLPYAVPGGAVTILGAAVWMMFNDRLITQRSHLRELASKQKEIDRLDAALTRAEAQRDKLMGLAGDVTAGIVRAIPAARDSVS